MKSLTILLLLSASLHAEVFDYATGYRLAQQSERPLIVFVEQDGCDPCHQLWSTIQKMDSAGEFRDCVLVRVNLTSDPSMTSRFDVQSTPVLDGYSHDGSKPSARLKGNVSASRVRDLVKRFTFKAVTTVKQVTQMVKPRTAVWRGRTYTAPVCNNPRCDMDWGPNGIGTQLNRLQAVVRNVSTTSLVPIDFPELTVEQIKLADQQPTPMEAVTVMLDLLGIGPGDTLHDIGSGDGRILVAAALRGARAIGIEIDAEQVERSRQAIDFAGVSALATVLHADATQTDLSAVRAATIYLPPNVTQEVILRLPEGVQVVSYSHGFQGSIERNVNGFQFFAKGF